MQTQMQGTQECFPTTIAMLLDVDKNQILDDVCAEFGVSNWLQAWNGQKSREVVDFIIRAYNLPSEFGVAAFINGVRRPRKPAVRIPVPKTGKGMMVIAVKFGDGRRGGHAVAFENGLVYDPELKAPMTEAEFNRVRYGWRRKSVAYIVPPSRGRKVKQ